MIKELPAELQNKIFTYLSHPCADIINSSNITTIERKNAPYYFYYQAGRFNEHLNLGLQKHDIDAIAFDLYVKTSVRSRYEPCYLCCIKLFHDVHGNIYTLKTHEGYRRVCEICFDRQDKYFENCVIL